MKFIIKRTLPVFLSLFAVIFLFSGCGDKSENEVLKGKWVPVSAVIDGETVQYSELELKDGYFEFNFKGNGSCTATLAGIEYKGSYVFSGTSVDATANTLTTLTLGLKKTSVKTLLSIVTESAHFFRKKARLWKS